MGREHSLRLPLGTRCYGATGTGLEQAFFEVRVSTALLVLADLFGNQGLALGTLPPTYALSRAAVRRLSSLED